VSGRPVLARRWITGAVVALAFTMTARAADPEAQRPFRDVRGTVVRVSETPADEGATLDLVVTLDDGGEIVLRLGPAATIRDAAWTVEPGHSIRARYFVGGGEPADVQRVRNEATGRTLRLRCIHGEPLWGAGGLSERGPGRGAGPRDRGGSDGRGPSR